jgi:hypothetical protein
VAWDFERAPDWVLDWAGDSHLSLRGSMDWMDQKESGVPSGHLAFRASMAHLDLAAALSCLESSLDRPDHSAMAMAVQGQLVCA